jgi:outer membrane protein OmpA-like peptidoglycan-associated protein
MGGPEKQHSEAPQSGPEEPTATTEEGLEGLLRGDPLVSPRTRPRSPQAQRRLVLALQRSAGNAAVSRMMTGAPGRVLQRDGLLDTVADRIGDWTDTRADEAKLDAAEDLADFMSRSYVTKNIKPTTGGGLFDAAYDPQSGEMVVTVRIAFQFKNGNIFDPTWLASVGGIAGILAKGWTLDQFIWTDAEERAWAAQTISDIQGLWSERYVFFSQKPGWEALPPVNVKVVIAEAPADGPSKAQWVVTVNKWPDDANMEESMGWPSDRSSNQITGTLHEGAADAGGVGSPDVRHFSRDTSTRQRYGQVDTDNPGIVFFDQGSSTVAAADAADLQKLGATLGAPDIPPFPVTVTGHASAEGKEDKNRTLSEDRARNVSNEIVKGGAKVQPTVVAKGEEGATEDPGFRNVEIDVGSFESDQRTALHEFGHMIGLDDEYPTGDPATPGGPATARPVGARPDHSRLAERLIPGQQPIQAHHDESILSNGEMVRPHHYVTFLEALGTMTGTTGTWGIRPGLGHGGRGPGDFPTPTPSPDGTVVV